MSEFIINTYVFAVAGGGDGIAFMGIDADGATDVVQTYDKTTWTTVNSLPASRENGSANGDSNSALSINGQIEGDGYTNDVLEYDGTNWSSVNSSITETRNNMGGGNGSGGMRVAGEADGTNFLNSSETFDGTNWASSYNIATSAVREGAGGGVTDSAQMIFGGNENAGDSDKTNTFDGSGWTEENDLPYVTDFSGGDSLPDLTEAMSYESKGSATWDGSNWTDETSAQPDSRVAPVVFYVSSSEVYVWSGQISPNRLTDGLVWDGSSFATATGTMNTAQYHGHGGINTNT